MPCFASRFNAVSALVCLLTGLVVSACGGGGGDPQAAATTTVTAAAEINTAAALVAAGSQVQAAATEALAAASPTTSNTETVGTARALSAESSLSLSGVLEVPPPARPPAAAASGRTFYVDSVAGDDLNNGAAASVGTNRIGPWKSLARVMQSDLRPGDVLQLACGSRWNETLRLPASGTLAQPIVVKAARSDCSSKPTIDGSVTLPPSAWTRHQGSIYKATVTAAPLLLTGAAMVEARHPNPSDSAQAGSPYLALAADGDVVTTGTQQQSTTLTTGTDLTLPPGASLTAGTKLRLRLNPWFMHETTVASASGSRVTLATPTPYPAKAGWGYMLVGQLWMLDSAGEWAYDPASRQLYAWMPDSAAPSASLAAATLPVGVDLQGRQYVTVDGVAVTRAGMGVDLRRTIAVQWRNGTVEDIAEVCVAASGSAGSVIEATQVSRCGTEAIAGESDNITQASGLTVRNNIVRDAGVQMQGETFTSLPRRSRGAIVAGAAAVVSENTVINSGYIGIRAHGGSRVENNFVYGACSTLDDCAGIYTWASANVTIRSNIVMHARGSLYGMPANERATSAQGIYLDELVTGSLVENNTVVDADHGIQLHQSPNNTLRGNRLYGNRVSQIWLQEESQRSNANGDQFGAVVTGNLIAPLSANAMGLWLQTAYTSTAAFGSFDGNRYYERATNRLVVVNTRNGASTFNLAQWRRSSGVGSTQPVDVNGTGVDGQGFASFRVSASNLVTNSGLLQNSAGWSTWNQTAPAGKLTRESCAAGMCLRYVAGGSTGLVSSPNFSVTQGQWYRLTVDLATEQNAQNVQLVVRRGGGGSNGYESLSDRNLAVTASKAWGRYSVVFRATQTIVAGNTVTADNGARVDIEGIVPGASVSMANMELVPVAPDPLTLLSGAVINVDPSVLNASCPFATTQPGVCGKFMNLADGKPVAWPLAVPARSAVILYVQEPTLVDSDGDGIADAQDRCPGTAAGAPANSAGCSIAQL